VSTAKVCLADFDDFFFFESAKSLTKFLFFLFFPAHSKAVTRHKGSQDQGKSVSKPLYFLCTSSASFFLCLGGVAWSNGCSGGAVLLCLQRILAMASA
jgi:hypothetical protein